MVYPTTTLMLSCVALSLSSCGTVPSTVASFCAEYTPVIVNKGDSRITAPSQVKRRLLLNEKLYQTCPSLP